MGRLIIEGNSVYEIDEECEKRNMRAKNEKMPKNRDSGCRRQNDRKNARGDHLK